MRVDNDSPVLRSRRNRVRSAEVPEKNATADTSDFSAFVTKSLSRSGSDTTNEEAIFSSLVHHGVSSRKDSNALAKFEERLEKHTRILERKVGYASEEKAAKFALRDLVRNKLMTKDEATSLYSKAFSGAQLDSDPDALSDGIGGNGSSASASIADVVPTLSTKMAAMEASSSSLTLRNLGERTTVSALDFDGSFADLALAAVVGGGTGKASSPVDGANGFLFKPISDTQGKLVVLTPEGLTGNVNGVVLRDSSGRQLESGRWGGVGNGGREHFRFSQPGGQYPANLTVEVQLKDGSSKTYTIPDPSQRYD